MSKALIDVMMERTRQIDEKGWTAEHDDEHTSGELAKAGACYALSACGLDETAERHWPWLDDRFKSKGARRDLVRAAAVIIAEIERLDRAAGIVDGGTAVDPS